MAFPTSDTYAATSGATLQGGRGTPAEVGPAWWTGKPTGQWFAIPGTTMGGLAGLNTDAFSDMTLRASDSSVFVVAAGGHSDGSSNGAAKITLSADSPTWSILRASSTATADVLYYADGRPTSRHTYHNTHYLAARDAVLLAGCRFGYGPNTPTGPGMDVFDLATNDYLTVGTLPDITPWGYGGAGYGVAQDGDGNIWTSAGHKFTVATSVWSKPGTGALLNYPVAFDSARNKLFALQANNGEQAQSSDGSHPTYATEMDVATGNSKTITLNASAAATAFYNAQPYYGAMAFCPLDGKFYFTYAGGLNSLFCVTPNSGATWDVSVVSVGGSTISGSAPLCKRFMWVPALNGFVVQFSKSQPLYFMRMS